MNQVIKILKFLNLLDSSSQLSLTNLAVYISLIKMASSHTAPIDAGALFATLMNYAHKRYVNSQGDPDETEQQADPKSSNPPS